MKKIFMMFGAVLFSTGMFAQNSTEAKKLLDEVSAKTKSYSNITIDFSYVLENPSAPKQEQKGNVILKGDQYRITFLNNVEISNGTDKWSISIDDEEVEHVTITAQEKEEGLSPTELLTVYEKGFTYKMSEKKTVNGKNIQYVMLYPEDKEAEYSYMILGIDMSKKQVYSLTQKGKNGSDITFIINSFTTNTTLKPNTFKFTKTEFAGYYFYELD